VITREHHFNLRIFPPRYFDFCPEIDLALFEILSSIIAFVSTENEKYIHLLVREYISPFPHSDLWGQFDKTHRLVYSSEQKGCFQEEGGQ
jgi:hypothetical protein